MRKLVLDESSIEICKAKETLGFLEGGGSGPEVCNFHLPLIHSDALGSNGVCEELNGGLVEDALLSFQV